MKTKHRGDIIIEKERILLIAGRCITASWCSICATNVQMLSPQQAALVTGLDQRSIFRRIERGALHYTESATGTALICLVSLRESLGTTGGS